ncbi:MAG: hypothetical protein U5L08_05045 [Xanthomonadales bacterium]|nr:hypothetical protein [Xanthomonadales bacterium]
MKKLANNRFFNVFFALLLALSVGILAGCEDQGPAEEAGENVDEAMEEAGEKMEEAKDEVDDATGGG